MLTKKREGRACTRKGYELSSLWGGLKNYLWESLEFLGVNANVGEMLRKKGRRKREGDQGKYGTSTKYRLGPVGIKRNGS